MSAWNYLKAGFWQRVPVPLLGQVPLNAVAFAGFGMAGFDHPAFWAAGAAWQTLWLAGSAGRVGYRRKIDARARRAVWRSAPHPHQRPHCRSTPAAQGYAGQRGHTGRELSLLAITSKKLVR